MMLAKKERLANLEMLHEGLREVIEVRAVAYADDPIGSSGLYSRRFKFAGSREYPVLVVEYRFDRGLLRELRKIEKHMAIEMGQWGTARQEAEKQPDIHTLMGVLHTGRQRVAGAKKQRDAEASATGETGPRPPSSNGPPLQ